MKKDQHLRHFYCGINIPDGTGNSCGVNFLANLLNNIHQAQGKISKLRIHYSTTLSRSLITGSEAKPERRDVPFKS